MQVRYEGMDGKGGEGEELDSSRKYEVRGCRGIAQTNIHKYSLKKQKTKDILFSDHHFRWMISMSSSSMSNATYFGSIHK